MNYILSIFDLFNINYLISNYAGYKSIIIKKNKYKLEIFEDEKGLVSDLQNIPYTWGRMGSATVSDILQDLKVYFDININFYQLSLF